MAPGAVRGAGRGCRNRAGCEASDAEAVEGAVALKQTEPVNVRSNRLDYDGASSLATYEGNAALWQDDTTIKADKIVVEDKTGNLHATTNVVTTMILTEPDDKAAARSGRKPGASSRARTGARPSRWPTSCCYEDAKHRATYTGTRT